eukprot:TRINITY_DN1768_c0_g1_i1.p1 TRINITY_DN1768_c0_g1~~TRINITY_DN1768_c0_g1_i1.p1  ORF type:complete len:338 (-),score=104.60 TRINITY_DN1768_c0_g1_i1:127-1140(-)
MTDTDGVTVYGFEGPEKRLEISFKTNFDYPEGLRAISKDEWQDMCDLAKCTIISHRWNTHFDAFVLSESSLFVYPNKVMIKTCGTTTLLKAIPKIMEFANRFEMEIDLVLYSRKNFLFPDKQLYPHDDWNHEIQILNENFKGSSHILGPMTKDHWYLYVADYTTPSSATSKDITLEVMMHNLERSAASKFYRKDTTGDFDKFPGVAELIPGTETDEFNFTPCGYSMNGITEEVYSTIHVTPEAHCSYASYETNLSVTSYRKLVSRVFDIFRPGTVTLTLVSNKLNTSVKPYAMDMELPGYIVKYKTIVDVSENCEVILCNYESTEFSLNKRRRAIKN